MTRFWSEKVALIREWGKREVKSDSRQVLGRERHGVSYEYCTCLPAMLMAQALVDQTDAPMLALQR